MIWSVPKSWLSETAVIVAGGPSLRDMDLTPLERACIRAQCRVITINDSWRLCPWADVNYFCDKRWYDSQERNNPRSLDGRFCFAEQLVRGFWICGDVKGDFVRHPIVHSLRFTGQRGLEADPSGLRHGNNSGYACINLAAHYGCKRIVLLGYDMRVLPNATHWHREPRPGDFARVVTDCMLPHFGTLVEPLKGLGIEVVNSTPGSALTCWPYQLLATALDIDDSVGVSSEAGRRDVVASNRP